MSTKNIERCHDHLLLRRLPRSPAFATGLQGSIDYPRAFHLPERIEIHRELGQFDLALAILDRIQHEDRDEVVDLIGQLSMKKQNAPWRFKWSSGWPATLIC